MYEVIEQFDATPNTNLLDVLGSSGYSLQSAIADIVDNSIAANAKNIFIKFEYHDSDSWIAIVDDGHGMNLQKLKEASTIAFKSVDEERKLTDLGRFSTGINSASASMCSTLIIQSKTKKDKELNTVLIDYYQMKEDKQWNCKVISINDKYVSTSSGTALIWKHLKDISLAKNQKDFYNKFAIVEKHLSHVFNDYISAGINIWLNDYKIKGWDPFFRSNIKTTKTSEEKCVYKGSIIKFSTYILPPINNLSSNDQKEMKGYGLDEQQGFYIYRKNRLIKEGSWLGIEDLSISDKYAYARIRVDIENTVDKYFRPNFLKNEIYIPDDLIEKFKHVAVNARNESRKNYNYMKQPSIVKAAKTNNKIPVWNYKKSSDGLLLSINDKHPIVESLCSEMREKDKRKLFKLLSNNLPIGEISRTGLSGKKESNINIDEEINDLYELLKEQGLTMEEIKKRMASCEPYCSLYLDNIIEFFNEKGML